MTVWNLGSINADHVYSVPHIPAPGETLAASALTRGLGGKGANMSVAVARAGGSVRHLGAVGADGGWMLDRLRDYGVDVDHVQHRDRPSGHAIITVDDHGENAITIWPGANRDISVDAVKQALTVAAEGDIFVTQNETSLQTEAAELAKTQGLRVVYAAAPFDAAAVKAMLPHADMLVLNEVEARQLSEATGMAVDSLPVADIVITLGAKGCEWIDTEGGTRRRFDTPMVTPVDTTGAGDTFTGYLLAARDRGDAMPDAITLASRAAALKVTRTGAADAIPTFEEVEAFRP